MRKGQKVIEEERRELNERIKVLNKKIGARLPRIQRQWLSKWIEDMKGWQKILQEKKKNEWEQKQKRQIEENIDKRCEMIKTDQEKMIVSLLNRPYKKIILNKFIKQREEETRLVTEPDAVKEDIEEHYKRQFRKRNTKLRTMPESWKEIYKSQKHIKKEWYDKIEKKLKKKNRKR